MNKTIILLLICLTVNLSSCKGLKNDNVRNIKINFNSFESEEINVKYGDLIIFEGRVSGSTGFFFNLDDTNLDLTLSESFDFTPENGLIGAPSIRYYNIIADKVGNHKVTFSSGNVKKSYDVIVSHY